ncbi:MAG: DivIVA domain-containing protein [Actinobacteria bacterium]|nr:DivIVA domain-containing protein [Actinomycetota bacterium]
MTPEPDHSTELHPSDIADRRFSIVRRGYDPDEVQRFLGRVAERLRLLEVELQQQGVRAELLERRSASAAEAAYTRISRHLTDVLRAADVAAASIRAEAEREARAVKTADAPPARAPGRDAAAEPEGEGDDLGFDLDLSSLDLFEGAGPTR